MSCVQAFTAALGFAMSAGWDWLPSMHTLWLRDYIEAVSMPTPFGFFGTLSGSIFFKMIMLLALCPVMERLFHAFPLDRVAFRRKPFPNADYALLPPALRERIYLSTPLILAQLCAILLLLVLTFSLPPCLDGLMPWLLGTVSALFGLIWFVLVPCCPEFGAASPMAWQSRSASLFPCFWIRPRQSRWPVSGCCFPFWRSR